MKDISIIGGGLAGLTLGILLRQRDVPVSVAEAGTYPRHRVCGEFISGDGVAVLRSLDLPGEVLHQHSRVAQTAAFFDERREIAVRDLPASAICISRYHLDRALAERFVSMGGLLNVQARAADREGRGIVDASGRRARAVDEQGARWVGLKMHARRVELAADLEMHVSRNAYIGLCRLANDEVNVCGLFRCGRGETIGHDALRGPVASPLRKKLAGAEVDDGSRCAIAGLSLALERIDASACRVGDAVTMIPPITGNGMSMAFESAQIAAEPLTRFAAGLQSWETTTSEVAALLKETFSKRLTWAARLHAGLFSWFGRRAVLPLVCEVPPAWRRAFHLVRR